MKTFKTLFTILVLLAGSSMFAVESVESEYCGRYVAAGNQSPDLGTGLWPAYLTISNIGNDTICFQVDPIDGDTIDFFQIEQLPSGFTSVSTETINDISIIKKYYYSSTEIDSFNVQILWSLSYHGGNAMLSTFKVPFYASCTPAEDDIEAPENFTASITDAGFESVIFDLYADDNASDITYVISYGVDDTVTVDGNSGETLSYTLTGLEENIYYEFNIAAEDASGNVASNNPIVLDTTTTTKPSSEYCGRLVSQNNHDGTESFASTYLTISNIDATSFYVQVDPLVGDTMDVLLVQNLPSGSTLISTDTIDNVSIKKTYSYSGEAIDSLTIQVQWSITGWEGQNILWEFKVPFSASCSTDSGVPTKTVQQVSENEINLYPNPVQGQLNISSEKAISQLSIYSLSGQVVKTLASQSTSVDVSDLESGIYLTRIRFEDGTSSFERIIKK